jgi:hypothetical protein
VESGELNQSLPSIGSGNGGTIYSTIPEKFNGNIFVVNNFSGTLILNNPPIAGSQCGANCWSITSPLLVNARLKIVGNGNAALNKPGGGTTIAIDSTFPAPIGKAVFNAAPTCGNVTGGTLSNGTYYVTAAFVNNLTGGNTNPAPPGYSAAATEVPVTCSAGGSGQGISFSMTAPAGGTGSGGSGFLAQDIVAYSATTSNNEGLNQAAEVTCPAAVGTIDPNGCLFNTGTVVIKAIAGTVYRANFPPIYGGRDASNPGAVLARGLFSNIVFDTGLEHLTFSCLGTNQDGGGVNAHIPQTNSPDIGVLLAGAQENAGLDDVNIVGPCATSTLGAGTPLYVGFSSTNSFLNKINIGSSEGAEGVDYTNLIMDARAGGVISRQVSNSTFAGRDSNGTGNTATAQVIVTGTSHVDFLDDHVEANQSAYAIEFNQGASGSIEGFTGSGNNTKAAIHIAAGSGPVIFNGSYGQSHLIKNDNNGNTFDPGFQVFADYTDQFDVFQLIDLGSFDATAATSVKLPAIANIITGNGNLSSEAPTADATYTIGNLGCVKTATNTVGDCGSVAANPFTIGILQAKDGSLPVIAKNGIASVNGPSSQTWSFGEVICTSASNAAVAVSVGVNTACPGTQRQIGIVQTTTTATLHTGIQLQFSGGSGGGGGSGTVNSGTAGQIAWYPSTAAAVSGQANLNISNGDLVTGLAGSVNGSYGLQNTTSGTIKIAPPAGALGTPTVTVPATTGILYESAGTNTAAAGNVNDFSAATGAPALKLPQGIGGTILAGTSTTNLSAPIVIQNTNSSNNQTSITMGITAPGTSTGQTVLNVNGATTGGDLLDLGTGGAWTAGVLSGQTIVAAVTPTGIMKLGTPPTVTTPGTAGGMVGTEGTQPASIATTADAIIPDSTSFCPVEWAAGVKIGCIPMQFTAILTSDWTCGTGGTQSTCVAAKTIGTLTFTLPLAALSWSFDCNLVVGQRRARRRTTGRCKQPQMAPRTRKRST